MAKCNWALVAVHWRDAFDGDNGWTDVETYKPTEATVVTVGWLWPDCLEGYVTLVNSYFPDEVPNLQTTGMPVHIPTSMVITTVVLDQPDFMPAKVVSSPSTVIQSYHNEEGHEPVHNPKAKPRQRRVAKSKVV